MIQINSRIENLKNYLKENLYHESVSFLIEKKNSQNPKCHHNLNLPDDFRSIEKNLGFFKIGINDYCIFAGGEPCYLEDQKYWGYAKFDFIPSKKYLFLGHDVDGLHYAYQIKNHSLKFICFDFGTSNIDENAQELEIDFLGILENKIYTHLIPGQPY